MEHRLNTLYKYLIPLLVVGISFGYTSFPICLALLVLRLVVTDKHTAGFFLIMYGGLTGGVIRSIYPFMPIYGLILNVLGVILAFDVIKDLFGRGSKSLIYFIITCIVFTIFYYLGPQDDFAANKLSEIVEHGFFAVLGFYVFCRCGDMKNESVLQIIFMSTLLMITFVIQNYNFSRGGLFDYEWFRHQEYDYFRMNNFEQSTLVSYQHIAMNMLFGLAIYLSQKKAGFWWSLLYIVFAAQLILMSGCRQGILGLILVLLLRLTYFRETENKNFVQKHITAIMIAAVLLIASYQFLSSLNVDFITNTLESGDAGRTVLLLQGLQLFTDNMVAGVGLGGYHAITGDVYPHNILVETLCECGLTGLFVFIALIASCFKQARLSILYATTNDSYLFLVLLAMLVRTSVSGDFTTSVEMFSAIYATLALSVTPKGNSDFIVKA